MKGLSIVALAAFACAALTLAGCSQPRERIVTQRVAVPVAQPCALPRPDKPVSLKAITPEWDKLSVAQKSAAASAWALDVLAWGEKTDAATSGCADFSD